MISKADIMGLWDNKLKNCCIYIALQDLNNEAFTKNSDVIKTYYKKVLQILSDKDLFKSVMLLNNDTLMNTKSLDPGDALGFTDLDLKQLEVYLYAMQYAITRRLLQVVYTTAEISILFQFIEALKQTKAALYNKDIYPRDTIEFFNMIFAEHILSAFTEELTATNSFSAQSFCYIEIKTLYIDMLNKLNVLLRIDQESHEQIDEYFTSIIDSAQNISTILKNTDLQGYYYTHSDVKKNLVEQILKISQRYKILKKSIDYKAFGLLKDLHKISEGITDIKSVKLSRAELGKYQESINYIMQHLSVLHEILEHEALYLYTDQIRKQIKSLMTIDKEIFISQEISTSMQQKIYYFLNEYRDIFFDHLKKQMLFRAFTDLNINIARSELNNNIRIVRELSLMECIRAVIHIQKFIISTAMEVQEELNIKKLLELFKFQFDERLNNERLSVIEICETILYVSDFSIDMLEKEKGHYEIQKIFSELISRLQKIFNQDQSLGANVFLYYTIEYIGSVMPIEEHIINKIDSFRDIILQKQTKLIESGNLDAIDINAALYYLDILITRKNPNLEAMLVFRKFLIQKHQKIFLKYKIKHSSNTYRFVTSHTAQEIAVELTKCTHCNGRVLDNNAVIYFNEADLVGIMPPFILNKLILAESLITDLLRSQAVHFKMLLKMFTSRCNVILQHPELHKDSPILLMLRELQ